MCLLSTYSVTGTGIRQTRQKMKNAHLVLEGEKRHTTTKLRETTDIIGHEGEIAARGELKFLVQMPEAGENGWQRLWLDCSEQGVGQ